MNWRRRRGVNLPVFPTPDAPRTTIFTSESEDFLRLIPLIVLALIFEIDAVWHKVKKRKTIPSEIGRANPLNLNEMKSIVDV